MNAHQILKIVETQNVFHITENNFDVRGITRVVYLENEEMITSITLYPSDNIEVAVSKKHDIVGTLKSLYIYTDEMCYPEFFAIAKPKAV